MPSRKNVKHTCLKLLKRCTFVGACQPLFFPEAPSTCLWCLPGHQGSHLHRVGVAHFLLLPHGACLFLPQNFLLCALVRHLLWISCVLPGPALVDSEFHRNEYFHIILSLGDCCWPFFSYISLDKFFKGLEAVQLLICKMKLLRNFTELLALR